MRQESSPSDNLVHGIRHGCDGGLPETLDDRVDDGILVRRCTPNDGDQRKTQQDQNAKVLIYERSGLSLQTKTQFTSVR